MLSTLIVHELMLPYPLQYHSFVRSTRYCLLHIHRPIHKCLAGFSAQNLRTLLNVKSGTLTKSLRKAWVLLPSSSNNFRPMGHRLYFETWLYFGRPWKAAHIFAPGRFHFFTSKYLSQETTRYNSHCEYHLHFCLQVCSSSKSVLNGRFADFRISSHAPFLNCVLGGASV